MCEPDGITRFSTAKRDSASVGTFPERLADMEKGQNGFGTDAAAARQLLQDRGLTAEVVKAAQAIVDAPGTIVGDPDPNASAADQQAAEDALWAWYLEWSGIARVAIHDGRLLRALGFLQSKKAAPNAPSPAPVVTPATPVVTPSPVVNPGPVIVAPTSVVTPTLPVVTPAPAIPSAPVVVAPVSNGAAPVASSNSHPADATAQG